jgi:DNA anti-recombination protein RmuC
MSSVSKPNEQDDGLEAAVEQAIAVCDGDMRAAVRALIVANNFLESEISELKKAVSHAYTRGAFGPTRDRCDGVVSWR